MRNLLVTGGAGFIGSNFIRHCLRTHPDLVVVNLDALTYAGNLENLLDVKDNRQYHFVKADICDRGAVDRAFQEFAIDSVVHFAAESHVDRSIVNAAPFVRTNVMGTQVLLEVARERRLERFVHVSTDEVYGSLGPDGRFVETTPLHPNSPYAASKAGGDMLVSAYHHTYGLPGVITRCSNNYGPYQFPEKLIPLMILNAAHDKALPVYGDGMNVRDWIHVEDHCTAIAAVLSQGKAGQVYNIGGDNEWRNIDTVRLILEVLGKPESLVRFVKDRPGHDRRYAMDSSKIRSQLGWKPSRTFQAGLKESIEWYLSHEEWCRHVTSGSYQEYYKLMYEER